MEGSLVVPWIGHHDIKSRKTIAFRQVGYNGLFGAAAPFSSELLDDNSLKASDASQHPHKGKLSLIVISGSKLMELVHKLYAVAANEA
jgi:hypothetical protein